MKRKHINMEDIVYLQASEPFEIEIPTDTEHMHCWYVELIHHERDLRIPIRIPDTEIPFVTAIQDRTAHMPLRWHHSTRLIVSDYDYIIEKNIIKGYTPQGNLVRTDPLWYMLYMAIHHTIPIGMHERLIKKYLQQSSRLHAVEQPILLFSLQHLEMQRECLEDRLRDCWYKDERENHTLQLAACHKRLDNVYQELKRRSIQQRQQKISTCVNSLGQIAHIVSITKNIIIQRSRESPGAHFFICVNINKQYLQWNIDFTAIKFIINTGTQQKM